MLFLGLGRATTYLMSVSEARSKDHRIEALRAVVGWYENDGVKLRSKCLQHRSHDKMEYFQNIVLSIESAAEKSFSF